MNFSPFPDDKSLDWSNKNALADDKSIVTQDIKVVFHRIENTVGKEENAGYQHFLWLPAFSSFPTMFSKVFFLHCLKSRHCVVKG